MKAGYPEAVDALGACVNAVQEVRKAQIVCGDEYSRRYSDVLLLLNAAMDKANDISHEIMLGSDR